MDVYARRRLVAVLAIVLVLVLIGVAVAGGGDDESPAPTTTVTGTSTPGIVAPLSQEDFISQADDICKEASTAIANISSDDAAKAAQDELDYTNSEIDQLRSLAAPEEDQGTLDDFFSAQENLADALDKRALALDRADDAAAAEAETEIDTAKQDVADAADAYGFKECGEAGEPTTSPDTSAPAPDTDTGAVAPSTIPPATTPPPATTAPPATAPPADAGGSSGGSSGGVGTGSGGVSP